MSSLKEIRTRIASVNNTRKITSAMKMVASSKLHHAQTMIENMLPYETMLEHILKRFLASESDASSVFSCERPVKCVALVVFSSNSSLCGGFNSNIIKLMLRTAEEYLLNGVDVIIYPIGRKVEEKAQKTGFQIDGSFVELTEKPNIAACISLFKVLGTKFQKGEIDRVELIYHHFKSVGSQVLTRKTYLPIDVATELERERERDLTGVVATRQTQEYLRNRDNRSDEEKKAVKVKPLNDNYIVEPDMKSVLTKLIPKLLRLMLYTALLDSIASEHAARMVAMQTATDNADELLRDLKLQYNKGRQQTITNELLDIVGGTVNN